MIYQVLGSFLYVVTCNGWAWFWDDNRAGDHSLRENQSLPTGTETQNVRSMYVCMCIERAHFLLVVITLTVCRYVHVLPTPPFSINECLILGIDCFTYLWFPMFTAT